MTATSDLIQKLYIGYFGRAGDPSGLNYWVNAKTAGMSDAAIAQSFSVQTEATSKYGYLAAPSLAMGQDAFLEAVYQNLFERSIDSAGLTYWKGQLNAGRPVGSMILDIINGAQGADATTVANKLSVANYYTEKVISANATWTLADDGADASSVIADVTSASSTVTTGKALADTLVAADVAPAGHTYTLSTGTDTVLGSAGADTIIANTEQIITGTTQYTTPAVSEVDTLTVASAPAATDTYDVSYRGILVTSAAAGGTTKADAATVIAAALNSAAGGTIAVVSGDYVIVTAPGVAGSSLPYWGPSYPSSVGFYGVKLTGGSITTVTQADQLSASLARTDTYNTYEYRDTLNARDEINGGDGVDTLKVTSEGRVYVSAAAVKNVEILNVSSGGYGASIDVSTWDSKLQTIEASAQYDNFAIGTNGNVTAVNLSADTSYGYGNYVTDYAAGTTAAPDKLATVTAAGVGGLVLSSDALTTLNMTEVGDVVVNAAAGARTLTLNANEMAGALTDATATAVVVNTTGAASSEIDLAIAKAATLTVNAGSTAAAGTTLGTTYDDYSKLVTVVSTGAGKLTADFTGATLLTSISATAATGAQNLTIGAATKTVSLGTGNDTLTLAATMPAGTNINLGAGNDKLLTSSGAVTASSTTATTVVDGGDGLDTLALQLVGAANVAAFKNFENFDVVGLDHNFDMDILVGNNTASKVVGSGALSGNDRTLQNLATGVGFEVTGDMDTALKLTLTQKTAGDLTITSNVDEAAANSAANTSSASIVASNATKLAVVFNNDNLDKLADYANSATINVVAGSGDASSSVKGATEISVVSGGSQVVNKLNVTAVATSATGTAELLTKITITGDQALELDRIASGAGTLKLATVDASGQSDGGLTFNLADLTATGTLKLGAGDDYITGETMTTTTATPADLTTIYGIEKGVAKDAAVTKGLDILYLASAVQGTTAATGYTLSNGKVAWSGAGPGNLTDAVGLLAAGLTAHETVVFNLGGSDYFIYGAGATTAQTDDMLVKLTGVTGVTGLDTVGAGELYIF